MPINSCMQNESFSTPLYKHAVKSIEWNTSYHDNVFE